MCTMEYYAVIQQDTVAISYHMKMFTHSENTWEAVVVMCCPIELPVLVNTHRSALLGTAC